MHPAEVALCLAAIGTLLLALAHGDRTRALLAGHLLASKALSDAIVAWDDRGPILLDPL